MDQLRAALDKFLQALAEEMRKNPQMARPLDPNSMRNLRSQDLRLGAKFTGINLSGCQNVVVQFVDVDRTLGSAPAYGIKMAPAKDCAVEYSRIHVGGIRPNSAKQGWAPNLNYAVELNNAGADRTERCRVHMNLISGVCAKGIYVNGTFDTQISENVFGNFSIDVERSVPPRMSSTTLSSTAAKPARSACSCRISRPSRSGMPAPTIVEIWRVNTTSSSPRGL